MKIRSVLHDFCTLRMSGATLILLALFNVCGCGGGSGNIHGNGTSGVRGVVTSYAGPVGNTPSAGTTFMPMSNAAIVVQRYLDGTPGMGVPPTLGPVLAQTTTDAQGNYSIPLAPGGYVVSVVLPFPNPTHTGVNVPVGQFVPQDFQVNTNLN